MMREISGNEASARSETLRLWLAGEAHPRAWSLGGATAALTHAEDGPGLSVVGDPADAGRLVAELSTAGTAFPGMPVSAVAGVLAASGLPHRELWRPWVWMYHDADLPGIAPLHSRKPQAVHLMGLDDVDDAAEIAHFLETTYPAASHRPGADDIVFWLGARDIRTSHLLGVIAVNRAIEGGTNQLASLAVGLEARGRGVGGALLVQAALQAESMPNAAGAHAVDLGVYATEEKTIALYQRLGMIRGDNFETAELLADGAA